MNCGPLRRLFTPRAQMRDEVMARARQAFFDQRVHHTADATGLLVYVSLHERLATILADQKALDAMEPSALDGLCAQLAAGLRQGDAAGALCEVIRGAARHRLAPRQGGRQRAPRRPGDDRLTVPIYGEQSLAATAQSISSSVGSVAQRSAA